MFRTFLLLSGESLETMSRIHPAQKNLFPADTRSQVPCHSFVEARIRSSHLEYHPGQIDKLLARADLSDEEKRGILGANALEYFCWRDTAMPAVTERPAAA